MINKCANLDRLQVINLGLDDMHVLIFFGEGVEFGRSADVPRHREDGVLWV